MTTPVQRPFTPPPGPQDQPTTTDISIHTKVKAAHSGKPSGRISPPTGEMSDVSFTMGTEQVTDQTYGDHDDDFLDADQMDFDDEDEQDDFEQDAGILLSTDDTSDFGQFSEDSAFTFEEAEKEDELRRSQLRGFGHEDSHAVQPHDSTLPLIDETVHTVESIIKFQNGEVDQVQSILGIQSRFVRLLLRWAKWNKENLLERFLEDPEGVAKKAGILMRNGAVVDAPPPLTGSVCSCDICCDDKNPADMAAPPCGHWYCRDCWRTYLISRIREGGGVTVSCMMPNCPLIIDQVTMGEMVPPEYVAKYNDFMVRNFVETRERWRWCPAPNCTNAVECYIRLPNSSFITPGPQAMSSSASDGKDCSISSAKRPASKRRSAKSKSNEGGHGKKGESSRSIAAATDPAASVAFVQRHDDTFPYERLVVPTVTCLCKASFCYICGLLDGHKPIICPLFKKWLKKCADDSETSNWISANTKDCPKCRTAIEKNGGCNHMSCRKCKYEFCWVCLGSWSEHGSSWYNCNRYDADGAAEARDAQAKSRASLERYLHYYNRYMNHEQSARLDREFSEKLEVKMEDLQHQTEFSWIEVQFLNSAFSTVVACRGTLKYTYAFAYYLTRNNMTAIFEDNQRDLEMAVEQLSGLLEKPLPRTTKELADWRQRVMDKTVYVESRRRIMVEDTERGLAERRWVYNVEL